MSSNCIKIVINHLTYVTICISIKKKLICKIYIYFCLLMHKYRNRFSKYMAIKKNKIDDRFS